MAAALDTVSSHLQFGFFLGLKRKEKDKKQKQKT